jgi:hypothetical protein
MSDDAGAAQARALLRELGEHVVEISHKLEAAELRGSRTSVRGATHDRKHRSTLRRELYEAHRLIDGLHRRYPETLPPSRAPRGSRTLSVS